MQHGVRSFAPIRMVMAVAATISATLTATPVADSETRWPAPPVPPEAVIVPWFELSLGEMPLAMTPINGTTWTWSDSIATLENGGIAVADARIHRIERRSPDGHVQAEWGGFDVGREGLFNGVSDVAAAPDGSLWVADQGNRRFQRFDRDGRYRGGFEVPADGSTGAPAAVAIGSMQPDRLYTIALLDSQVTVFTPDGTVVTRFAAVIPCGDGQPLAIDVAPDGTVVVGYGRGGCVLRFTADGAQIGRLGALETFDQPNGLAVAEDGTVWIADAGRRRVVWIGPDGASAGGWDTAGSAWPGDSGPGDVDVAPDGTLWIGRSWSGEGAAQPTLLHVDRDGKVLAGFTRQPRKGALTSVRGIVQTNDGALWLSDAGTGRIVALVDGRPEIDHSFNTADREKIRSVHAASFSSVFATANEGILRVDASGVGRQYPSGPSGPGIGQVRAVLPPLERRWAFLDHACTWQEFVNGVDPERHGVHGLTEEVCDAFDAERVGDHRYALLRPHLLGSTRTLRPAIFEITDDGADPELAKLPDDLGLGAAGWSDPRFAAAGRGFWLSEVGDRRWPSGGTTNPPRAYRLDAEGGIVTRWGESPGPYELLGPSDIADGRSGGVSAWICDCPTAHPPNAHRLIAYAPPTVDRWFVAFYANRGLTGWPTATAWRDGVALDERWGRMPPADGLAPGAFTARFQRPLVVPPEAAGTHRLRLSGRGAVRLWVDESLVVDEPGGPVIDFVQEFPLSAGLHLLRIDHRALDAAAALHFDVASLAPPATARPSATATPTRTRTATRTATATPRPTATWPATPVRPEAVLVPWFELPLGPPPPDGFAGPEGLAVLSDGTVAVADARTQRVTRLGADGGVVSLWGGFDLSRQGMFRSPWDVVEDAAGTLWVPDSYNRRLQRFDRSGRRLGGFAVRRGVPFAVAIGPKHPDRLYTLLYPDPNVTIYDPSGAVRGEFAATSRCGSGQPMAIDVAPDGTVVIGYNGPGCVMRFTADGIQRGRIGAPDPSATPAATAMSSRAASGGEVDAAGQSRRMPTSTHEWPTPMHEVRTAGPHEHSAADTPVPCPLHTYRSSYGLAVGDDGSTWVADRARLCLFRIRADGTPAEAWSTDGGEWPDGFAPWDVDVAPDGSLWVAGRTELDAAGAAVAGDAPVRPADPPSIVHVAPSGAVLELWGRQVPETDVSTVAGITQGADGLLWLADGGRGRVIGLRAGRKEVDLAVPERGTELTGIDAGADGAVIVAGRSDVWRADAAGIAPFYAPAPQSGANDMGAVVAPDDHGWAYMRRSCHFTHVDAYNREQILDLGAHPWRSDDDRCRAFDVLRIPGVSGIVALIRSWREGAAPPALYQRFGQRASDPLAQLPDERGLGGAGWLDPRIASSANGGVWLVERGNTDPVTGTGSVPPRAYRAALDGNSLNRNALRVVTRWGDQPGPYALLGPADVADGRSDGVAAWVLDAPATYSASAQRLIAYAPPAVDRWHVAFFADRWLTSWPVATDWRDGIALHEDWGIAPPVDGVPAHGWSARFQRPLVVAAADAGAHTLRIHASGAARVWVDDRLFVDEPVGPLVDAVRRVDLAPGLHRLRVDYAAVDAPDGGGAGTDDGAALRFDLTSGAPPLAPAYLPSALKR